MNDSLSLMGNGFIGSRYSDFYPDTYVEPRDTITPVNSDVLYTISTTDNYSPLKMDLHKDVDTNLTHLMKTLPNVMGRFTFLSSWFVYGFNNWGHHPAWRAKESHLCNPKGFYSATKLCAEQLIQSYCATVDSCKYRSDVQVLGPSSYQILRLSNVIGNDPRAGKQKNALEWLLTKVIAGEDVPVYEGDNFRDFLHVDDVCSAINLCMKNGSPNEIYNIGRGESHKMVDIIDYAIDRVESFSKIVWVPVPDFHKIVQVQDFFLDTTKLRNLGFKPKYTIWESVDKVLEGLNDKQ